MKNEKGDPLPKSFASPGGDAIVYSFAVGAEKLEHAAFLFWIPNPPESGMIPEICLRVRLKQFVETK